MRVVIAIWGLCS